MAKIIIIGAGIGGLSFVYKYIGGAKLVLYESKARDELAFPWHDSVKIEDFSTAGIPLPEDGVCGKKIFDMYSPSGNASVPQRSKTVSQGYEIDRIALIEHLLDLVSHKVELNFETEVIGLVKNGEQVVGVKFADGSVEYCDLVIDASGGFSRFRQYVCEDEFDYQANESEMLFVSRSFYKLADGQFVDTRDSVYIKRLGSNAISWCRTAPQKSAMDVFVSNFGKPLDDAFIEEVENDLRSRHDSISRDLLYRLKPRLPLRYPLAQMVYDGYVAVGDSAFSANPVNGCGIGNALRSGAILVDVVNDAATLDVANLWSYQVRFMREIGSTLIALDIFKRWIKDVDPIAVDWLFETMIGEDIIKAITSDEVRFINPMTFIKKIPVAFGNKELLLEGINAAKIAVEAKTFALIIPPKYDKKVVSSWKKRYNGYIRDKKYLK